MASAEEGRKPEQKVQSVESSPVTVKLADAELLDQDGNRVRFRNDVVKDRLVVIDVFYTTCPLVCPIFSAVFSDLQDVLGDRLGREVFLISISVDPVTDTPTRLKEHAQRWEARPGWIFLTGTKPNLDQVLQGLDAYTADFTNHPTMVLVGDGARGGWARFDGFPTPEMLLEKLHVLREKRGTGAPSAPAEIVTPQAR
jgi:protein SCO1/2